MSDSLSDVTLSELVAEIASRGWHGVVALDRATGDMPEQEGGGGGVFVLGHPAIAVGMADDALRRAREAQDDRRTDTELP